MDIIFGNSGGPNLLLGSKNALQANSPVHVCKGKKNGSNSHHCATQLENIKDEQSDTPGFSHNI